MEQINWKQIIKTAKETDQGFEELLFILKPKLEMLSYLICVSQLRDDDLQTARIRIWEVLKKVKTNEAGNAEAFLLKCASNAMYKWLRDCRSKEVDGNGHLDSAIDNSETETKFDYLAILALYLDYIRETGSFYGAHKKVAKILGISWRSAGRNFKAAAKEFIEKYNLQASK